MMSTDPVDKLIDQGVAKKHAGDYVGAKALYYQAIGIDPFRYNCYWALAKICYLTNEHPESVRNYLRAFHIATRERISRDGPEFNTSEISAPVGTPNVIVEHAFSLHAYAKYTLVTPVLCMHLGHAVWDHSEDARKLPADKRARVEQFTARYVRMLARNSAELPDQDEALHYYLIGIGHLFDNVKWPLVASSNRVLEIYPDPSESPSRSAFPSGSNTLGPDNRSKWWPLGR